MKEQFKIEKIDLPIIPLRGMTVFPHMVIHFDVGRDKSIKALEKAMEEDSILFLSTQKDPKINDPKIDDFYHIGSIAKVKQMIKIPGGSVRVLAEGINRGKISEVIQEEPYLIGSIESYDYEEEAIDLDLNLEAARRLVISDFREYGALNERVSKDSLLVIEDIKDPGRLVDIIASYIYLNIEDNQKILETFDFLERLEVLHGILQQEIEVLEIEDKINERVKKQINKLQKEHYLKEQIKAIQTELGEDEDIASEVEEYREKFKALKLPKDAGEKVDKELDRLMKMSPYSAETGVIRNYLEWMISLPWNKEKREKPDLKKAKEVLNKDHYGLEDVKERILEFIAIRKLSKSIKGPIICLVGPPGVGKTSIAKSIAESLNRDFVRMSLGGVRDEAEIRGHRRTYVGAMPGRIVSSLRRAGSKNPVFLLDEIDKLGNDYRGDPASGLLEVLDPEQNTNFIDHFIDTPFDLSKVLFITTANTTATIPRPLLDRMEVIRIGGYTEEEKLQITKRYLLPKQVEEHGLNQEQVKISDEAIRTMINNYTREAGVRNLERNIATVCRKSAKKIVEEEKETMRINVANIYKFLGSEIYRFDSVNQEDQIGVANGLAWTAVGGETLSIEVTVMEGKGKIQLTGKLGDVMKESAMAGISYIRANSKKWGIEDDFYEKKDIHIHVPEGAIPKDGPSAGVTIATAIISVLSERPIDREVAMTGEITLRGRVLPVGGIKEKVLAANRMGIKKVILPIDNKRDMDELPDNIKKTMKFVLAKTIDDVLEEALVKKG